MKTEKKTNVKANVMTAFFAAIIYLGIQSFRIPMPAAVGTPFVHFGHIFVVLAILLLGTVRSMVAGVLGLLIFDVLNGYLHAIPNVFVSTVILCLLTGTVAWALRKKAAGDRKKDYRAAIVCAVVYGVVNVVIDFVWSTAELVIAGSGLGAALAAEITAIPATIINAVFTVIGIAILYIPVRQAYKAIMR
ncbi:MAG: ECF transporter S component [Eubacteriales bacterium]|nr:ECF transporter S component [Eubacteriales bacterium]